MRVINFGSLNIDHVYPVAHFVKPGETIASYEYQQFVGGKGLNQSIALARAGAEVLHAGSIGADGGLLKDTLAADGVDTGCIQQVEVPSGHAIIQVDPSGENCILLHGGANQCNDDKLISRVMSQANAGDVLLLQNEINGLASIIESAAECGLTLVFNPAPMSPEVAELPLDQIDYLILNQSEAHELSGEDEVPQILATLRQRWPESRVILTLGQQGAVYQDKQQTVTVDALPTSAVDTTAAGDTFIGYFLAALCRRAPVEQCLQEATKAAALCIQRPGAATSIPYRSELSI